MIIGEYSCCINREFSAEEAESKRVISHEHLSKRRTRVFIKDKPKFSSRQLLNGYWINVNLSIKNLVFAIGKLCEFCSIDLSDVKITYVPKQGAGGVQLMSIIKDDSARFAQQTIRDAFRAWLIEHNPDWSGGTVTMHYSDAYYLYNNKRV